MKQTEDFRDTGLLVIDMLNDFVLKGAPLEVPSARRTVSNIKRRIGKARKQGIPIIYICDAHRRSNPEFRLKVWPPHAIRGTTGARVVDELKPQPGDTIVRKTAYSGFYRTRLDSILKKRKLKNLILTGVVTNICILYTAADAAMRGYGIIVPKDSVCGLSKRDHDFALRQIRQILRGKVV